MQLESHSLIVAYEIWIKPESTGESYIIRTCLRKTFSPNNNEIVFSITKSAFHTPTIYTTVESLINYLKASNLSDAELQTISTEVNKHKTIILNVANTWNKE